MKAQLNSKLTVDNDPEGFVVLDYKFKGPRMSIYLDKETTLNLVRWLVLTGKIQIVEKEFQLP